MGVNSFFDSSESPSLEDLLSAFIYSSVHKSPKTIKTLHETLNPFVDYLKRIGIDCYLAIKREHVEGFIREISQGRRGKPLSPASVFAFTRDVKAFINYLAEEWTPEDRPNPVRRIPCKKPQVFIRPFFILRLAIGIVISTITVIAFLILFNWFFDMRSVVKLQDLVAGELLTNARGYIIPSIAWIPAWYLYFR